MAIPDNEAAEKPKWCSLPLSSMPAPFTHVRRWVLDVRQELEQAVAEQTGGEVSIAAASRIATVCTCFRQIARIERILNDAGLPGRAGGLSHEFWQSYSDRIIRYRESADRGIRDLGLDAGHKLSAWERAMREQPEYEDTDPEDTDPETADPSAALAPPTADNAAGQGNGHLDGPDAVQSVLDAANGINDSLPTKGRCLGVLSMVVPPRYAGPGLQAELGHEVRQLEMMAGLLSETACVRGRFLSPVQAARAVRRVRRLTIRLASERAKLVRQAEALR